MKIEPTFTIMERHFPGLGDKKVGQKSDVILNYQVIEKTKSFVMLKISYVHPISTKRSY